MKETVSKYRFKAAFAEIRPGNFTDKGLSYLYDYLINLEDDTGVESELDVIGICCEFSEYKSVDDLCNAYDVFNDARKKSTENDEDVFAAVRDVTGYKTSVVCFEPDCIIVQNFMKKYENMNVFAREFIEWANEQDGVIAGYAGEWVESGQKMEQYISEGCNESGEVYDEYYSDEMPNEDAIRAASVAYSVSYDGKQYYEPSRFYTFVDQGDLDSGKRAVEEEKIRSNKMKETVLKSRFKAAFAEVDNFTDKGLSYLYDYLIEFEEDTGVEEEIDVFSICCEFSEYKSIYDLCNAYYVLDDVREESIKNGKDVFEAVRDVTGVKTVVVCFEPECIIIRNFDEGNIRKKKEQTIKKEMLTVKFRYLDSEQEYRSNTITIGIFDTIEEAVQHGNDVLESLTANPSFNLRQGEKFRVHELSGLPSRLITNCTSNCPVEFYVKITRLDFDDLHKTIDNVLKRVQSNVAQA